MNTIWVYLMGLGASTTFAISGVVYTRFARLHSPLWVNAFKAHVALLSFGVAVLVMGLFRFNIVLESLLSLLLSGLIGLNLADSFLLRSFKWMGSARTLIIFSFEPLFLAAFTYFLKDEALNAYLWLSLVFFVLCASTLSLEGFKNAGRWEIKGIVISLIAVLLDCVGILLTRHAFDTDPGLKVFEACFLRSCGACIGFFIMSLNMPYGLISIFKNLKRNEKLKIGSAALLGTFVSISLWLAALSQGTLASVVALGGTGPVFSTLFECLWSKKWPSLYLVVALVLFALGFSVLLITQ